MSSTTSWPQMISNPADCSDFSSCKVHAYPALSEETAGLSEGRCHTCPALPGEAAPPEHLSFLPFASCRFLLPYRMYASRSSCRMRICFPNLEAFRSPLFIMSYTVFFFTFKISAASTTVNKFSRIAFLFPSSLLYHFFESLYRFFYFLFPVC